MSGIETYRCGWFLDLQNYQVETSNLEFPTEMKSSLNLAVKTFLLFFDLNRHPRVILSNFIDARMEIMITKYKQNN